MKDTMFARFASRGRRALWNGALLGLLLAVGTTAVGKLSPEGERARDARRGSFSLFAGPTTVLASNLLQCGIDNQGNVCTDVFNSPTGAGGFWPAGSVDAYIFNTGLQIAGIIPPDEGGPWANDTVAAYIFDARGGQQHSAPLSSIYDSNNSDDLENWPQDARVTNTDLFDEVLTGADGGQGAKAASQQDSWTMYWDGDPTRNAERKHPMGIRVTQRSLAWNFPAGNESVIYFVYDFENATADPDFQAANEIQFFGGDNVLPDGGWTIGDIYASFSTDMDVGADAIDNFSTAILPFDVGISYVGSFDRPEMVFPPDLFFPPFFTRAPGIVGVKYLKSPIDPDTGEEVGLTLFSNTQNPSSTGAQFIDPLGDEQLWRYLSGQLDPSQGDPPCNVEPEIATSSPETTERSVCFVFQQAADTRFYQASGPFALGPGDQGTIVVAYMVAATVATLPDGSPSGILANQSSANANPPGVPSFHPGYDSARGCDVNGANCTVTVSAGQNVVKPIEKGAGWFEYTGPDPTSALESPRNKLDQFSVSVVPGSLLDRALIAQTVFDNKFLLPFAPVSPRFWLAEGDGVVTIVWDKSDTELPEIGDPFYAVASDETSTLFNPNYRKNDVEGYRIYRGTDPSNLGLIAQFDYDDTSFDDYLCETVRTAEDFSQPEYPDLDPVRTVNPITGDTVDAAGYAAGDICPVGWPDTFIRRNIGPSTDPVAGVTVPFTFNNGGGGPGQGVARAADLSPIPINIDTVLVSDGFAPLSDGGVPFGYNDEDVQNNFTYFYAVTAFDVNSATSAPSSLESVRIPDEVVPRANSPEVSLAEFQIGLFGDDDEQLNPNAPLPQIDGADGTFSGPFPPTNGIDLSFIPLATRLFPAFERSAIIDSLLPFAGGDADCASGESGLGTCWKLYVTQVVDGVPEEVVFNGWTPEWGGFSGQQSTQSTIVSSTVEFDKDALADFGIPDDGGAQTSGAATAIATNLQSINYSSFEGQVNRRAGLAGYSSGSYGLPGGAYGTGGNRHGGSRWFDGTDEAAVVYDPGRYIRVGHLEDVDTVWAPIHHTPIGPGLAQYAASSPMQCFGYGFAFLGRAADVQVTWQGGTFGTVRDVTHHVDIRFHPDFQGGTYGFLNTDGNGNGVIDWGDFDYLGEMPQASTYFGTFCQLSGSSVPNYSSKLEPTPVIQPTSTQGDSDISAYTATGQGFGLYINGERYIFELQSFPEDGTLWTLRTYSGFAVSDARSFDSEDPSGYEYVILRNSGGRRDYDKRPGLIPGLKLVFQVEEPTTVTSAVDLSKIHTVPDPYLATSSYDLSPTNKQLMFVNLPTEATIRIYTLTGILVRILDHEDITGGGRITWDLRNRNNQFVASGVYFFHVATPAGQEYVGKFTIVNFAGQN